jgi:hypothetical protein
MERGEITAYVLIATLILSWFLAITFGIPGVIEAR